MITREDITTLRKEMGLTQQEVADICGLSRLTVLKWEQGAAVRPSTSKRIREALSRYFRLDTLTEA